MSIPLFSSSIYFHAEIWYNTGVNKCYDNTDVVDPILGDWVKASFRCNTKENEQLEKELDLVNHQLIWVLNSAVWVYHKIQVNVE